MLENLTIVRNSEVLPSDGKGSRLWRSGIYAKFYHERGLNVRWVTSSFDHYNKKNRDTNRSPSDGVESNLVLLKTPGYADNTSIRRTLDHFIFGFRLFLLLLRGKKPDLVLCSFPTPESSVACLLYGQWAHVPVVLDIRDKWPDVLMETETGQSEWIRRAGISVYSRMRDWSMRNATSLIAANPEFLAWGRQCGNRGDSRADMVSYIPFEKPVETRESRLSAEQARQEVGYKEGDLLLTFAGTIGYMFNLNPLLEALRDARAAGIPLKVIICGDGATLTSERERFADYPEVLFTGRIDSTVVFSLLRISDLLWAPYKDLTNFRDHLPNKIVEYCAAERGIVSSLQGLVKTLLEKNELGMTYASGAELFSVLKTYHRNRELLESSGTAAKQAYESLFHPSVIMQGLDAHLQSIASKGEGRHCAPDSQL